MRNFITISFAAGATFCASPVFADQKMPSRPEIFQKLVDCRKEPDSTLRLACFDSQIAKFEAAENSRQIILVDKGQVKEAKKGLFGFSIPKIPFLTGDDSDAPDFIEATIASVRQTGDGMWQFRLADGANWRQIETKSIPDPKAGDPIRIRKAALGSYLANIKGRTAIRVRRDN